MPTTTPETLPQPEDMSVKDSLRVLTLIGITQPVARIMIANVAIVGGYVQGLEKNKTRKRPIDLAEHRQELIKLRIPEDTVRKIEEWVRDRNTSSTAHEKVQTLLIQLGLIAKRALEPAPRSSTRPDEKQRRAPLGGQRL